MKQNYYFEDKKYGKKLNRKELESYIENEFFSFSATGKYYVRFKVLSIETEQDISKHIDIKTEQENPAVVLWQGGEEYFVSKDTAINIFKSKLPDSDGEYLIIMRWQCEARDCKY